MKSINNDNVQKLFEAIGGESKEYTTKSDILSLLHKNGIEKRDRRVTGMISKLEDYSLNEKVDFATFANITRENTPLLSRCMQRTLIIPDFDAFSSKVRVIFDKVKNIKQGELASYIPQLARVNPDNFAVSICTIDNQRLNLGDHDKNFCVQSTHKPINYCLALDLHGEDYVHQHVGREPSGRSFNEIKLNRHNLPHNPMINAGAIMCASMIYPQKSLADRFDYVNQMWAQLCGGEQMGYDNSVYHSEKATADRNFALAYFMRENGSFPENTNIVDTLDFYFQCCSMQVSSRSMSTLAATFANSGVCPHNNGEQFFTSHTIKNSLSLMHSCGMYDFSGEFAFSVGLPAKSGVSGVIWLVIPNLMGIVIWSPLLDINGNSVRGIEFCKELVKNFNFHNYDNLIGMSDKVDPRTNATKSAATKIFNLIYAASHNSVNEIKRLLSYGVDINASDYDKRTALHLAVAEQNIEATTYLINNGADPKLKDRWGATPLSEAKKTKNPKLLAILADNDT